MEEIRLPSYNMGKYHRFASGFEHFKVFSIDSSYPPGNKKHIPYLKKHFWVDDVPNFPWKVGYVMEIPG